MNRSLFTKLGLAVAGGLAVWGLFSLPRTVVKDEKKGPIVKPNTPPSNPADSGSTEHMVSLEGEEQKRVDSLTFAYQGLSDSEKKLIFADSLGSAYARAMQFDSSAKYYGELAQMAPGRADVWEKAGTSAYRAFRVSQRATTRKSYAEQAMAYFDSLLNVQPNRPDIKAKKGVLLVAGQIAPMQGIGLLKEAIAEDPNNVEARLDLGEFQLTVNKVDLALVSINEALSREPSNVRALLLAIRANKEAGNTNEARQRLMQLKNLSIDDPYIKSVIQANEKELQ